jgi:hypothetical protein
VLRLLAVVAVVDSIQAAVAAVVDMDIQQAIQ